MKPAQSTATPILGPYLIRRLQQSKVCQALAFRLGRDPSEQEERLTQSKEACPEMESASTRVGSTRLRISLPGSVMPPRPGRPTNESFLNFPSPSRSLGRQERSISGLQKQRLLQPSRLGGCEREEREGGSDWRRGGGVGWEVGVDESLET